MPLVTPTVYSNHYQATPYSDPNQAQQQPNTNLKLPDVGGILGKIPGANQVTSAVNSVGTNLGFGSGLAAPAPSAGFVGPMPLSTGALGSSATLTGTLGAAGVGALAGGFLGKVGGNETGGSIGGALGGAAGMLAGGAGSLLLPGIGILAGGLLGGFFGGKKNPHPFSGFGGAIDNTGTFGDKTNYSSEHTGTEGAKGLSGELSGILSLYNKAGINFNPTGVNGGIDSKGNRGAITVGSQSGWIDDAKAKNEAAFQFALDKPEEKQKALMEAAAYIAKQNGASEEQIAAINAQYSQMQNQKALGQANGGGSSLMVAPRDESKQQGPTFSQWLNDYKKTQQANKA